MKPLFVDIQVDADPQTALETLVGFIQQYPMPFAVIILTITLVLSWRAFKAFRWFLIGAVILLIFLMMNNVI